MQSPTFRARSAPEILDAGFQAFRAAYPRMLLVCFIISLPAIALDLVVPPGAESLLSLVHSFLLTYAGAAVVVIVSDLYLARERSVGEVLRAVLSRFGSIWGAAFMKNLMVGVGLILLVVPGVIAFVVSFAMIPAVVLEGASASQSFDRSRALARGAWGKILLVLAITWVLMYGAYLAAAVSAGAVAGLLLGGLTQVQTTVLAQVLMVVFYPFAAVAPTLLYYDARIRNEGFDIQMLMGEVDALATPAPAPAF